MVFKLYLSVIKKKNGSNSNGIQEEIIGMEMWEGTAGRVFWHTAASLTSSWLTDGDGSTVAPLSVGRSHHVQLVGTACG
jgi:hypothetical protein